MLMNHKNFHFTRIPDKTNDVIFLKSPQTLFLGHFGPFHGHFCPVENFPKKPSSVTHMYGSLTPCQVSEKTNEPNLRELTDRRKDKRTDRERTDRQGSNEQTGGRTNRQTDGQEFNKPNKYISNIFIVLLLA